MLSKFNLKAIVIFILLIIFSLILIVLAYNTWSEATLSQNIADNLSLYNKNTKKINTLTENIDTLGKTALDNKNYTTYLAELENYKTQISETSLETTNVKNKLKTNNNNRSTQIVNSLSNTLSSQVELLSSYKQAVEVINCVVSNDSIVYQNGQNLVVKWQKVTLETTNSELEALVTITETNLQANQTIFNEYPKCFTDSKYYSSDIVAEIEIEKKYTQNLIASVKKVVTSINTQKKVDFDSGINEVVNTLKGESKYQKYLKLATEQNIQDLIKKPLEKVKLYQDDLQSEL